MRSVLPAKALNNTVALEKAIREPNSWLVRIASYSERIVGPYAALDCANYVMIAAPAEWPIRFMSQRLPARAQKPQRGPGTAV